MTQRIAPHLFSAAIFFCLIGLIVFPSESLDASTRGLELWWTIIFPSLLPFFILSDLLPQSNWTSYLGRLMEPLMKPVFNVSGQGAIVLLLGFSSGFPVGAKMSVKLYNEGKLSLIDAQRLVCFTNGASPIFIMGAIAAGLLHTPKIGILLLIAHYLGNIIIGILAGRLTRGGKSALDDRPIPAKLQPFSFGHALQTAVVTSVQQLLVIGGLIIFFSVISELAVRFHLFDLPVSLLNEAGTFVNLSSDWATGFLVGILEISNGVATVANADHGFLFTCVLILAIVSFGGFCIHAQIIACIHDSPIRYYPFLLWRIVHLFISPILFIILFRFIESYPSLLPLFGSSVSTVSLQTWTENTMEWFHTYGPLISIGMIFITIIILSFPFYNNEKKITWR